MAASDMSVLRSPIQIGVTGFLQLLQSYHVGTDEVKQALFQHCDFIMECKFAGACSVACQTFWHVNDTTVKIQDAILRCHLRMYSASKNGASTKNEGHRLEVENKRKQSMPKKCESELKTKSVSSSQCMKAEEVISEMPTESSCDKTLKVKLDVLESVDLMKANASLLPQSNSHAETDSTEERDCKQQQVNDQMDETNKVDCSIESSSSQSSVSSSAGEITFIAANISSECKKHPTKGLYQCVDCSKFFAGIDVTVDTKQPQCKKCRKVVTN